MLELTYPNGFPVHVNPYAVVTITQAGETTNIVTTNGEFSVKEDLTIVSQ
jgi:cell division septal protein FtsQ